MSLLSYYGEKHCSISKIFTDVDTHGKNKNWKLKLYGQLKICPWTTVVELSSLATCSMSIEQVLQVYDKLPDGLDKQFTEELVESMNTAQQSTTLLIFL